MPRYKDSPEARAEKQERIEKLRELLALTEAEDVRDLKSVFKEMVGEVLENGLEAELDDRQAKIIRTRPKRRIFGVFPFIVFIRQVVKSDYRNKDTDNSRNGHSVKTVISPMKMMNVNATYSLRVALNKTAITSSG